jgi:hypothetical protein
MRTGLSIEPLHEIKEILAMYVIQVTDFFLSVASVPLSFFLWQCARLWLSRTTAYNVSAPGGGGAGRIFFPSIFVDFGAKVRAQTDSAVLND